MNDAREKNLTFYKGKRVLVTGHTGFKGAWLSAVLRHLGAEAAGYALAPEDGSLYRKMEGDGLIHSVIGDLADGDKLNRLLQAFQPEIIFHLAAFGFVRECYDNPVRAYETNLMGTVRLMEALRGCGSVRSVVIVSTDKVYENKDDGSSYRETDPLGGIGPYAGSKTCMEYMVRDYRETYFQTPGRETGIATVRASNVLGGGDHIQTRLIPTILRCVAEGRPVELRNPDQTRPWQSVLDALNGYLTVGRLLYEEPRAYSDVWNIGPTEDGIKSVSWVFEAIERCFHPLERKQGERIEVKEAKTLGLNIERSSAKLRWGPVLPIERTVAQVAEFFQRQQTGEPEREIMMEQIREFFGGTV